jgi:hypothetical protein
MDIAKYVAISILISSFLGSFEKKEAVYVVGAIGFLLGIWFIHDKKIKEYNMEAIIVGSGFVVFALVVFLLANTKKGKEFLDEK